MIQVRHFHLDLHLTPHTLFKTNISISALAAGSVQSLGQCDHIGDTLPQIRNFKSIFIWAY